MDEFIQLFGEIPLSTAIVFIVAISFLVVTCSKVYKFIVKTHDSLQEKNQALDDLKKDVRELKEHTASKEQWKELKEKQINLEEILNQILETQKVLVEKQQTFEEENHSHNVNRLRDRLLQSYRYYTSEVKNPMLAWTEMEKEAFDNLLADYYAQGGNSFVHTKVDPEMASLEVISITDSERMAELSKSRKG
jgi:exonuclease VII large subunit